MNLRLSVVEGVEEDTAGATIRFRTGQTGQLSRSHGEYPRQLALARTSRERRHPVGVRIDNAGEIREIARADNDHVARVVEQADRLLEVWFQGHDAIGALDRQHPRFEEIRRDLGRSLQEKKRIWFIWRLPERTLQDVMILEEDVPATPLTDLAALPAELRPIANAAAVYLRARGEEPAEFYPGDVTRRDTIVVLPLWHVSALVRGERILGNPGGKCRDLEYDTATGRIAGERFWQ